MKLVRTTWLIVVCIAASNLFITHLAHANDPYAGKYDLLKPPQPTDNPEKVEVLEFFWYGCQHCYYSEIKLLQPWLKTKPDYAEFKRIPAVFSLKGGWTPAAKAYHTASALDILEKIHLPFFEAIHGKKKQRALLRDKSAIQGFFAKHGVSKEQFDNTYDSFWVGTLITKAKEMSKKYKIKGVPVVFVNGKYRLSSEKAGGYAEMQKVLNYLIEKEHRLILERKSKAAAEAHKMPTPEPVVK